MVSRMSRLSVVECPRCIELEAGFNDPLTPNPGAFLYGWATHRLDAHGDKPGPRADCAQCARFAAGPEGVHSRVWERWTLTHYMKCELAPDWEHKPPQ